MNNRNEGFVRAFVFALVALVVASILCTICSQCFTPEAASIIGGVLSAIATGLLGGIAIWQNKRYKELADEFNERAYMPELYKAEAMGEIVDTLGKSKYNTFTFKVAESDGEITQIDCGQFMVMNSPILNVEVKSIVCAGKTLCFSQEQYALYTKDAAFSMFLRVPSDFVKCGTAFEITFTYENIYGTKYTKTAAFTLNKNSTVPIEWKLDKARKVI